MAKKSTIAREEKRDKLSAGAAEKIAGLKEQLRIAYTADDEQLLTEAEEAQLRLQKVKRNALKVRKQNRCRICGRPRAVYRRFGLCRIHLREALMRGDVTGAGKSSW